MPEKAPGPLELPQKTVGELRDTLLRVMAWCPETEGEKPHLWSAHKIRLGLVGARGQHLAQGELECVRCGTTAVLQVSI